MLFRKSSGTRLLQGMRRLGVPAAILLAGSVSLHAETLKDALAAAYLYNPTLKSARAQLRSTDNGVSLAKSGYRPTVTATFRTATRTRTPKRRTPMRRIRSRYAEPCQAVLA